MRAAGYDFKEALAAGGEDAVFDPIGMSNEYEVLVRSDTVFDFVEQSEDFTNGYVFSMRSPDRGGKSNPATGVFLTKDRGLSFKDGVLAFSNYNTSAKAPVRKTSGINRLKIEYIELPDSVVTVEEYGFRDCRNLKSIQFGKNLETICEYAFKNCVSLEEIMFPKSLEVVGEYAFTGCGATHAVFTGDQCDFDEGIFSECPNLEYCILPKRVEYIPDNMFLNCAALKAVDGLEGATEIGESAFEGCIGLGDVRIPAGCKVMERAFANANIGKLTIGGGCSFGTEAFHDT